MVVGHVLYACVSVRRRDRCTRASPLHVLVAFIRVLCTLLFRVFLCFDQNPARKTKPSTNCPNDETSRKHAVAPVAVMNPTPVSPYSFSKLLTFYDRGSKVLSPWGTHG